MPAYPWLYEKDLDLRFTSRKLKAFATLGAPYTKEKIKNAASDARAQAQKITDDLVSQGVQRKEGMEGKQIIALIAYLQRLGTDIKPEGVLIRDIE
jgi:cytochrome c oxidase cbb3-type subunit I/II